MALSKSPHLVLWFSLTYLMSTLGTCDRYQWPRVPFCSKYSSNFACVHIFPRRILWANNSHLRCLHETSRDVPLIFFNSEWEGTSRDRASLSIDGLACYLLSAVCGQLIDHYLLGLVANPAARPSCTFPVPNLASSTWACFAKG